MKDQRGFNITLTLPDVAALEVDLPELKAAADEYQALTAKLTATSRELDGLIAARGQAEDDDRRAYARAIRANKPDPGAKAMAANAAAIAACSRRHEATQVAVDASAAELAELVAAHRERWVAEVDTAVTADRAALVASIDSWAETRRRLDARRALRDWLARFPDRLQFRPVARPNVAGLTATTGDPFPVGVVESALRREAEEPVTPEAG